MWSLENEKLPHQIQNSDAWHEWRRHHLGASEVPAIMGTSDWGDAYSVFTSKIQETLIKSEDNWAMIRGRSLEPVILARFEQDHGCKLTQPVSEFKDWPILHASLDGWWEQEKAVIEAKAPAIWKHTMALCGLVPDTYIDQLQTQMLVTGADKAYYVSFHDLEPPGFDIAYVLVHADRDRQDKILKRCKALWGMIEKREWKDGF